MKGGPSTKNYFSDFESHEEDFPTRSGNLRNYAVNIIKLLLEMESRVVEMIVSMKSRLSDRLQHLKELGNSRTTA